jgi:hypothetical protein
MENLGAGVVVVFVKTAAVKRSGYLFVQSKYLKCLNNLRFVAVIFLKNIFFTISGPTAPPSLWA